MHTVGKSLGTMSLVLATPILAILGTNEALKPDPRILQQAEINQRKEAEVMHRAGVNTATDEWVWATGVGKDWLLARGITMNLTKENYIQLEVEENSKLNSSIESASATGIGMIKFLQLLKYKEENLSDKDRKVIPQYLLIAPKFGEEYPYLESIDLSAGSLQLCKKLTTKNPNIDQAEIIRALLTYSAELTRAMDRAHQEGLYEEIITARGQSPRKY